jgi:hypothetical protein
MGTLAGDTDMNTDKESGLPDRPDILPPRYVPCYDATGRVRPITQDQHARNERAIAKLVEEMLAMPDEDPPGAWEDAMRDLDAQRPHRKLLEGHY